MSEFWELWLGIGATFFTITFLFMILSILIYWRQKMDLNEAITHAREVAREKRTEEQEWRDKKDFIESNERNPKGIYDLPINQCKECAAEHEQLAEWLTELQERREADKWNVIRTEADLPKESDFYLVTIADKYTTYVNTLFFMKSTPDMWEHDKRVLAWKPLPKPYESEAENG